MLLLVVTCQLCLVPGLSPSGALAAESPGPVTSVELAPEQPSAPPAQKPTEPAQPSVPGAETPTAPAPGQQPGQPVGGGHETAPAPPARNTVELSVSEGTSVRSTGTARAPARRLAG